MNRAIVVFLVATSVAIAQSAKKPSVSEPDVDGATTRVDVPVRTLDFEAIGANPELSVSPITNLPPQCTSDGYLFLDTLDPKDLRKHTVVAMRGSQYQVYSPSSISDLHDISVMSFFPSSSHVGFLVRGAKAMPGTPGPGKSSAGIEWTDYHNYIAEFDRSGRYEKAIELPFKYRARNFAILPSDEFLVTGYDDVNSAARLLFLNSSGELIRRIDLPAGRHAIEGNAPYRSPEAAQAASQLMGYVLLTPYKDDILVWHLGSGDPVLDIGKGASVREVPITPPSGFVFDGLIASTDRWVAHFRSKNVAPTAAWNQTDYAYYELRPQDASPSAKLVQAGDIPLSIACQTEDGYIAFKRNKDNKLVLLTAK